MAKRYALKLNGKNYKIKPGDSICWDYPAPFQFTSANKKELKLYIDEQPVELEPDYWKEETFDLFFAMMALLSGLNCVETMSYGSRFKVWTFVKW